MFEHGLVVGKFAPLHCGHERLLDIAQSESKELTVLVYASPDFADMPSHVRADWVRRLYPRASVLVPENPPLDAATDQAHQLYVRKYLREHGIVVDAVFTAEHYGDSLATTIEAKHRPVSKLREVSGTILRAHINDARESLPSEVYAHFVELIVMLGAESTGKSTLTRALADEFDTAYVAEHGRDVWEEKNGELSLDDYVDIATRHLELEEAARRRANRYVFVDTNAMTTMMLSYAYEGDARKELIDIARSTEDRYKQTFLCDDDIPFAQDGWRDNDVWRNRAQGMVRFDLELRSIPYIVLSGSVPMRVARAKQTLSSL